MSKNLSKLLNPKSIAIVGASQNADSVSYKLLKNIISGGYTGKVFPINPKYDDVQSLKCYKSISELPTVPDLSIIVIPAAAVYQNIVESASFGVKNFYIFSSGFSELGADGKKAEQALTALAQEQNLNILGPNTVGFVNNELSLNANFTQSHCGNGNAVLISQSGALLSGIMNLCASTQIGLKYCISIGNQCDVSVADLIEYFEKKSDVSTILLHLEAIKNPSRLREICTKTTKKIVCIKSGTSARGAQAASSHTGALASSDVITDAFLKQCGIVRAGSIDELIAIAFLLATTDIKQPPTSVAIVTNAGGPAIMAIDALSKYNINLYDFTEKEKDKMRAYLPKQASVKNPIDMIASASVDDYKQTLELCASNKKIDTIVCIHLFIMETKSQEIAQFLEELKAKHPNKYILGVFITDEQSFAEIKQTVKTFPAYNSPELCALALHKAFISPSKVKNKLNGAKNANIDKIISQAKNENRMLTTYESLNLLKELKLPLVGYGLAKNVDEAVYLAQKIGFPLAIKITSKVITHKSDVGGVKVGINNVDELKAAIKEILSSLKKRKLENQIDGFILQEMKSSKREFVYGIIKDGNYGLCSMFGRGGIFVEAIKDVAFKVLPASPEDVTSQINSLQSSKLLGAVRNLPPANIEQLTDIMTKINNFAMCYDIAEMDLNPLLIDDKTGDISLIDARIKF